VRNCAEDTLATTPKEKGDALIELDRSFKDHNMKKRGKKHSGTKGADLDKSEKKGEIERTLERSQEGRAKKRRGEGARRAGGQRQGGGRFPFLALKGKESGRDRPGGSGT